MLSSLCPNGILNHLNLASWLSPPHQTPNSLLEGRWFGEGGPDGQKHDAEEKEQKRRAKSYNICHWGNSRWMYCGRTSYVVVFSSAIVRRAKIGWGNVADVDESRVWGVIPGRCWRVQVVAWPTRVWTFYRTAWGRLNAVMVEYLFTILDSLHVGRCACLPPHAFDIPYHLLPLKSCPKCANKDIVTWLNSQNWYWPKYTL